MMVEYGEEFWKSGWAPLYSVLGGNPLAAMPSLHFATSVKAAHVLSDTGRAPERSAGPMPSRSASRWCISASTTSSTSPSGSPSPRASGTGAPRRRRRARVSRPRCRRSRRGARMSGAPEQDARSRRRPGTSHEDDERGLEFTRRSVLTLCGFLLASLAGALLPAPKLAGLQDTWQRIEDGSPWWMSPRSCSRSGCTAATW